MKYLKKCGYLLSSLLCLMVLTSMIACGSDGEDETVEDSVTTDAGQGGLKFSHKQSDQKTLKVKATTSWVIENCPDWLSASEMSGEAGDHSIVLTTTKANNTSVELSDQLVIKAGTAYTSVTVMQSSPYIGVSMEVVDQVFLSYGFACKLKYGDQAVACCWHIYKESDFNSLSESKISSDAANWDYIRKPANSVCTIDYSKCEPSTNYKLVVFPYTSNNEMGERLIVDFKTKSKDEQPLASIESTQIIVKDGIEYIEWNVKQNAFSNKFYTYVCSSPSKFNTYKKAEEFDDANKDKRGALLALLIENERKIDQTDSHEPDPAFNEGCHEQFFAPASKDGVMKFERKQGDRYVEIVTWAENANGSLSGIVSDVIIDLDNMSKPEEKTLTVSTKTIEVVAEGGTKQFTITSNDSWTVTSNATSWCTASPSSGDGNATVTITVAKNTSESAREATVKVKGTVSGTEVSVSIKQQGTAESGQSGADISVDDFGNDKSLDDDTKIDVDDFDGDTNLN